MSRRHRAEKRQVLPDPKFKDVILSKFMNQIMQNRPMTVFGSGEQVRAFTYIGDIAPLIAESVFQQNASGGTFNVGAEEPYTVNQLSKAVATAMGVPDHPVQHLDARDEVVMAFSDHSRCREVFGEQPSTSLDAGIQRMAEWARQVGPQSGQTFNGVEVDQGLPKSWQDITG